MKVAPRVGAWIETVRLHRVARHPVVAPRVGAWIETVFVFLLHFGRLSRPVWARFNILENKLCPAWVEIADQHD